MHHMSARLEATDRGMHTDRLTQSLAHYLNAAKCSLGDRDHASCREIYA